MFRLDNRRALVTGAGSGIGEATAFALASRGAMVYVADRDEPNGRRVADAIRATGAQASFVEIGRASCRERV